MILAIVGPTAVGKSRVALDLAPAFGAEILSVDSTQAYRGLDAGTAKADAAERALVPHHLLDLVGPGDAFSVAEYQRAARRVLDDVRARGRTPLLVGGTGLYFRAIVDDLEFPPTDADVRARLDACETEELWRRLLAGDPAAAERIQPANKRRIVRALEVAEITGRPFSSFRTSWDRFRREGVRVAGLHAPVGVLRARIEERTRRQFAGVIQEETKDAVHAAGREWLLRVAPIGYPQALALLEGRMSLTEAMEDMVRACVDLARRQMRWFRRDPRITWIDATDIGRAGAEVEAYWSERPAKAAGGA